MDVNFFENDIVYQIFNINHNKIVWKIINFFKKSKNSSKIFQEYSKNVSHKAVRKVVQKQVGVGHVSHVHPFPP